MKMSAWSLACQQSVFQRYKSEKNIYESFTHKMAAKAAGIEITSLTPCVSLRHFTGNQNVPKIIV